MFPRPSVVSTLVATVFAVAVVGFLGAGSLRLAGADGSGAVRGIGLVHLGDTLSNASNQGRYPMVVVSPDDAAAAAGLPGKSLVYFAGPDVNTQWNAGVPYSQALANGWLLTDASGGLMVNKSYANDYLGDIGSAAYQAAWVSNVSAFVASSGVDGVFIDDIVRDSRPLAGGYPAKYPSQQAWEAAMVSFMQAVGPALKAKGYYVLINGSGYTPGDGGSDDGSLTVGFWQQLGPYVSGLCTEYYQQTAEGSYTPRASGSASWMQFWDGWQKLIPTAQAMGVDFVGMSYGAAGDTKTMMYGDASFLMEWNGAGGAYMFDPFDNSDPWNPAWTTDIGTPAAAKQQVGSGWMRAYTGGIALVNPSPSSSQSFQLGGSYLTSTGDTLTSVTLPPTGGLILHTTAAAAPTTTAPAAITTTAAPATTTTTTTTTAAAATTTTAAAATTTTAKAAVTTTAAAATTTTAAPATTTTTTTTTTTPATTPNPLTTTSTTTSATSATTSTTSATTSATSSVTTTTPTTTTTSSTTTPTTTTASTSPTVSTSTSPTVVSSTLKEKHHNRRHL